VSVSTLGPTGERDARAYLESKGMRFIASNWRCLAGELDLVMLDRNELVFVEVKARKGDYAGRAEEAVGKAKSRKLLATGEWFVSKHPEHHNRIWRIDLLALTYESTGQIKRIGHIENAIVTG
jgi:putative endonuclease